VITRVHTNVTTKATKHSISGSLPAAITSRCHHETIPAHYGLAAGRAVNLSAAALSPHAEALHEYLTTQVARLPGLHQVETIPVIRTAPRPG
jgi:hypothetical protein